MTTVEKVSIGGFRNIKSLSLNFKNQMISLLAPNNYGKSNVLDAIMFGYSFIKSNPDQKNRMMGDTSCISINKYLAGNPYYFEIEGTVNEAFNFRYRYGFEWVIRKNGGKEKRDGRIIEEYLGIRNNNDIKPKFLTLINRNNSENAKYNPSETGRCSKEVAISPAELVLNKLSNYDDWHYIKFAKEVLNIKINAIDSLSNPEKHFGVNINVGLNNKILHIENSIAESFYNIQKNDKNLYEFLVSSIINLVPTIEKIDARPIQIKNKTIDKNIPFELPDQYQILVKEENNNQSTPFQFLSTGCMKVMYLLLNVIKAQKNGANILIVEELENSVHPKLLQSLLSTISDFIGETRLIFTSHSPNLAQYLNASQLYVGLPSHKGIVDFKTLKPSRVHAALKIAGSGDMSLGEYLFQLMLDVDNDSDLVEYLFGKTEIEEGGNDGKEKE
ncbi:MAG: AAA family ATPase [Bacteroidales bacterium]|nr:AAA family ATPase [Bacteroidales bacterium]